MHKLAVVGDVDSIYGFSSIGIEIFPCENSVQAMSKIKQLSSDFGIIFVIQSFFNEFLNEDISKFNKKITPAIISIPGINSAKTAVLTNLRDLVKRAVGFDMLDKII